MSGGVEAGHHRSVRGKGFGNGRVRLPESRAARGERIEGGSLDAFRLGPDGIGARGIQRDEQDPRLFGGGRGCGWPGRSRSLRPSAGGGEEGGDEGGGGSRADRQSSSRRGGDGSDPSPPSRGGRGPRTSRGGE